MKKVWIIPMLIFFLFTIGGCSSKQIDASSKNPARAEGQSSYGTLKIFPKSSEGIEQLGAPSVYGEASDYSITGDYSVVFEDLAGKQTIVSDMDDMQIIEPNNATIHLNKLNTDDADIFYFIPQYRGSNDVPIYFFGITKDGNAFEFKVENNKAQESGEVNALSEHTVILSTNSREYLSPVLNDENITFKAVYNIGAGQNYEIYNVAFHADIKNRVLKFVSKEVLKLTDENQGTSGNPTVKLPDEAENTIDVQGQPITYSLHSIDFIDGNTGWVVENRDGQAQQGSQLLQTQDGGKSWKKTALDNMTLNRIKFIDQSTGWAVAQTESKTASGVPAYAVRILYTRDGGLNWEVQWEKVETDSAVDSEIWFEDPARGYVLAGELLLSTGDGGKQWSPVTYAVDHFTARHMSFTNADSGWVIGEIGQKTGSPAADSKSKTRLAVLRTTDGGKHWRKQFDKTYDSGLAGSIDIDFVNGTTGWFLTSDAETWNGDLYYTANAGQDWKKINRIPSMRPSPRELEFLSPDVGWIPLQIGAGGADGGLMLTRDGGRSFEPKDSFGSVYSVSETDFISRNQGWAIGNSLGCGDYILHTANGGGSWTQVYPRIVPTEDMSFVDNAYGYGLGQLSDAGVLLRTTDGGDSWEPVYSFAKGCYPSKISFISRDTGWVLAQQQETAGVVVFHTSDGGRTWTELDGSAALQTKVYSADYMRFFDEENGLFVSTGAGSGNIYRTRDGGKNWEAAELELEKGDIDQFAFVSAKQGWKMSIADKTVSLSGLKEGSAWELLKQIGTDTYSYGVDFLSEEKGWMLVEEPAYKAGSLIKLMVTADGGHTWSSRVFPKGIEIDTVKSQIPMQFTDDGHGWILTRIGLLKTENGGKSWNWK